MADAVTKPAGLLATNHGMHYMDFLPWLLGAQAAKNYLEIGVAMGSLLALSTVETAIGVDPNFIINSNVASGKKRLFLSQSTSDQFFEDESDLLRKYPPDIAFLDGMHLFEYLLRDFFNTEAFCSRNALIVMHDCLPMTEEMCDRSQHGALERTVGTPLHGAWTGDVWKIVPILNKYRTDLRVVCIDAAPTGLVCVTGLDSSSTILADNYQEIVEEFSAIPNTAAAIADHLYDKIEIVSATEIHAGMKHGSYFRARA